MPFPLFCEIPGLYQGQIMLFIDLPDTQGYANLRIITPGTAYNLKTVFQQLVQPFFYDGFTIASGNAHNRQVKLPAMKDGERLQGPQAVLHQNKICLRKIL